MKKRAAQTKSPYGIYRKGFFIPVAGAESERLAAKVAGIREQPEHLRSIRANERPDGTDGVLL